MVGTIRLQNNYYKYPAVIPSMDWLDTTKANEADCCKSKE